MKKIMITMAIATLSAVTFAAPHGGGGGHGGGGRGPAPMHHNQPHHHGGGTWGHGGRNFWPGFVGGVVGGVIGTSIREPAPVIVTTPTVVTTPVVTTPVVTTTVVAQPVSTVQNVWVEGCYVNQLQANGTVLRVWQPGHYEQRTVIIQ